MKYYAIFLAIATLAANASFSRSIAIPTLHPCKAKSLQIAVKAFSTGWRQIAQPGNDNYQDPLESPIITPAYSPSGSYVYTCIAILRKGTVLIGSSNSKDYATSTNGSISMELYTTKAYARNAMLSIANNVEDTLNRSNKPFNKTYADDMVFFAGYFPKHENATSQNDYEYAECTIAIVTIPLQNPDLK